MNTTPIAWPIAWLGKDYDGITVQLYYETERNKLPYRLYENAIPLYEHPAKTLTDEEIDQTITDCGYEIEETVMGKFVDIEGINMYNSLCGFARAILRKAQEK
jgi:hypothetical protein